MRILHIIATLDPASGGPSESVRVLMGFTGIGYAGEAVTLDDPRAPYLRELSFPIHAVGPVASTYGFSIKMYRWLKQNVHRFDGMVVNGLWNFCGLAALLAVKGKKPYMVFSHGMLDPYFKKTFPLKHAKKWVYWLLVEYWVLRGAYRLLFTTPEEAELARQSFWLHRWNGYVVPYGASRPPACSSELTDAFYSHLPTVRGRRFMLYLGRIHRKKGCDLLIRAFCQFADRDPGLDLVMAGPDQQGWSDELKRITAEAGLEQRVHWPGMIRGQAKWGAFYDCEVFVLPSHQENFGIAVAEALSCEKPVLLSDQVNIAGQIARDGCGLVQPDTQAGTDALLSGWLAMPQARREAMADQALVTFRERYDMEQNAAAIIKLFAEATAGASSPDQGN